MGVCTTTARFYKKQGSDETRVLITEEEYKHFEALEDAYWSDIAKKSRASSYSLSGKELEDFIENKLTEDA